MLFNTMVLLFFCFDNAYVKDLQSLLCYFYYFLCFRELSINFILFNVYLIEDQVSFLSF